MLCVWVGEAVDLKATLRKQMKTKFFYENYFR